MEQTMNIAELLMAKKNNNKNISEKLVDSGIAQWGGRESAKEENIPWYAYQDTINSLNRKYGLPENYNPNDMDMDYIKKSIEFTKWMNRNNYLLPSSIEDMNEQQLKAIT